MSRDTKTVPPGASAVALRAMGIRGCPDYGLAEW
jgi:hypothetical protein